MFNITTERKLEYPSPIQLSGKASRYISIPASFLFDPDIDSKDISTFIFLRIGCGLDNIIYFTLSDVLVKWNGFTPNRNPNGVNQKFMNALEKLKDKGYILNLSKVGTLISVELNYQKIYDECRNYSFGVLYVDEVEKILDYKNFVGDKYLNIPVLLNVFSVLRTNIFRRPNRLREEELYYNGEDSKEKDIQHRRELFPEAYNTKFVDISKETGIPSRTISKAISILEELGLFVTSRLKTVKFSDDEFHTQDIIIANAYKREGVYLLDDTAEYSEREIENKKKMTQYKKKRKAS